MKEHGMSKYYILNNVLILLGYICAAMLSVHVFSPESWPAIGGERGDFFVSRKSKVQPWHNDEPPILWRRPLGKGYSGIVGSGKRIFTVYRSDPFDIVICLDSKTGLELWKTKILTNPRPGMKTHHGIGPNSTPVLVKNFLVTLSFGGDLSVLDSKSGELRWSVSLIEDFDATHLEFGFSSSPVFLGNVLLVPVGGEYGMVAFNINDGTVIWRGEATEVSYGPPKVVVINQAKNIVYLTEDEVVGLNFQTGKIDWRRAMENRWGNHASSVLLVPDQRLFVASQAETGAHLFQLTADGSHLSAQKAIWSNKNIKVHYWNSVIHEDFIITISGESIHFLNIVEWSSGKVLKKIRGYKPGNFLKVNESLIFLEESGDLSLMRITKNEVNVLSKSRIFSGKSRTAPSYLDGILYMRDHVEIVALSL